MIKRLLSVALAAALALAASWSPATAQQTAKVVATCGSASYTAGTTNYVTQDTTGSSCGSATSGGTVQPVPGSTGGATPNSSIVANNTTSVAVCTAACNLYGVLVFNNSATIAYLKLYNAAQGSTTCGAGTPVQRILIPANTSGAGAVISFPLGVAYSTALTRCVTTGIADADTSAPAASAYIVGFIYK